MIEIQHWPANSTELIEAGQWLQLIYVSLLQQRATITLAILTQTILM